MFGLLKLLGRKTKTVAKKKANKSVISLDSDR